MFQKIRLCLRYWWVILIITVITTSSAAYLSYFYFPSVYSSETTIYVLKTQEDNANLNPNAVYQDLLASDLLVKDYQEIVKSSIIIQMVREELQDEIPTLRDATIQQIKDSISVTVRPGTRLIVIGVEQNNPDDASAIANKIAEVFQTKSLELLKINNISIIDRATAPTKPDSPQPLRNMAVSLMAGIVSAIVLILFIDYVKRQLRAEAKAKAVEEVHAGAEAKEVEKGHAGAEADANANDSIFR